MRQEFSDADVFIMRIFVTYYTFAAAMFTLKAFFKKLNSEPVRPNWKNIVEQSQLLVLYAVGVLIATVSWLVSPFNTDVPVEAFYALWSIGISVWTIAETLMSHSRLPKVFLSDKAQTWYLTAVVGCQILAVARLTSNIAYLRFAMQEEASPNVVVANVWDHFGLYVLLINVLTDVAALATETFSLWTIHRALANNHQIRHAPQVVLSNLLKANMFCIWGSMFDVCYSIWHLPTIAMLTGIVAGHGFLFYGIVFNDILSTRKKGQAITVHITTEQNGHPRKLSTIEASKGTVKSTRSMC